jgi:hypothetical protein
VGTGCTCQRRGPDPVGLVARPAGEGCGVRRKSRFLREAGWARSIPGTRAPSGSRSPPSEPPAPAQHSLLVILSFSYHHFLCELCFPAHLEVLLYTVPCLQPASCLEQRRGPTTLCRLTCKLHACNPNMQCSLGASRGGEGSHLSRARSQTSQQRMMMQPPDRQQQTNSPKTSTNKQTRTTDKQRTAVIKLQGRNRKADLKLAEGGRDVPGEGEGVFAHAGGSGAVAQGPALLHLLLLREDQLLLALLVLLLRACRRHVHVVAQHLPPPLPPISPTD